MNLNKEFDRVRDAGWFIFGVGFAILAPILDKDTIDGTILCLIGSIIIHSANRFLKRM